MRHLENFATPDDVPAKPAKPVFETIDFEGISTSGPTPVADGYDGLNWTNAYATLAQNYQGDGPNGFLADLHSGDSIALGGFGAPMTLSSDSPFRLVNGYFASGWNDGETATFDAWRNGVLVGERKFILNPTSSFLHLGKAFAHVDSVTITASGGVQDPGVPFAGALVVMDDVTVKIRPSSGTTSLHTGHHAADHHLDTAPTHDGFVV